MAKTSPPKGKAGFALPSGFQLSEREYEAIRKLVKQKTGISLGLHKKDLVVSRLARRLRELNLNGFEAYIDYLNAESGDTEMVNMINRITTNKTDFFREGHHFQFLTDRVLHEIVAQGEATGRKVLRCWSAGCSTGEEPYTLAITLSEFFSKHPGWDVKILASDLDTTVLTKARDGVYEAASVEPIPRAVLNRYFLKRKEAGAVQYEAKPELKGMITFRKFNLMSPSYPLKVKLDFVFCRNVLIYFDNQDKIDIVSKFHHVIKPNGYIFIGHSESLMMVKDLFKYVGTTVYHRI